jgi:DNA-binding phage protein
MTRAEHIKKVNENRRAKSDEKVQKILDSLFVDEYKKPNGKLNISKIAKDANVKREVVYRVLEN